MAADTVALPALLECVEAATGPDRELDGDLALTVAGWTYQKMTCDLVAYWRLPGADKFRREKNGPPAYTASLDAALALVEAKMPGAKIELTREGIDEDTGRGPWWCWLGDRPPGSRGGPTGALAVLSALLRAMIAEREKVEVVF